MKRSVRTVGQQLYSTDNWRKRRKVLFAALGFIAVNVEYLILFARDDGLRQNIAVTLTGAGVAIIGSYVFGAVWDDNNKRDNLAAPDQDAPASVPAPPAEIGPSE